MYAGQLRAIQLWIWQTSALLSLAALSAFGGDLATASSSASNVMALSLDQLLEVNVDKVYGASKFEQKISRAPSSVSIVTRDEITHQGYRTLADALRSVNGLFVSDDRNYSYLGFRGFARPGDYNSRVLLLVDGHRVNDNVYEQGLYGTEGFLDIDAVERVEVIRGPSSSIYGNNAFFGVVNVITRKGRSLDGLETTVAAGDNDTYKVGATFGKSFTNGLEMLLSGSVFDTSGDDWIFFPELNSPTNNNGVVRGADHDRAYHFYGSLTYQDFTLSGGWAWRRKRIPTASYNTAFNDRGEHTMDERSYVDLKWEHEFDLDLRAIGRVAYDRAYYLGEYPYGDTLNRIDNRDSSSGEAASTEWQLNWRVAERHTFIAGLDFRENLAIKQRDYDIEPYTSYLSDHRTGRNVGFFGQAEIGVLTNLLLNIGGRYDYYSTFGGTVNPRLGLIYNPWAETTFKLLYGSAFRAPNAYELYYNYPGQSKANPDLKAERIYTYELICEQQLPANLRGSIAGYYYEVENLASQILDPADNLTVFRNLDRVRAAGVELGLEGRFSCGAFARLSYALQRTEDRIADTELSNSPRHMAKLNVVVPLWADKVFAGVDLQYYSGVRTVTGHQSDDSFVMNATVFSQRIAKNLEASASVYNVFNQHHGFSASSEHRQDTIPLAGRSFLFKLTYRF